MQNPTRHEAREGKQLELFRAGLPHRPYAVDRLGHRLLITSTRRALRRRYIQANPPWMRVFAVFDVDRPGAALAWEDAALPAPLWTAVNRENGHAHTGWALEAPVLLGQHDRQAPMRYLCAVESAMRERLEADPGYAGLLTKNPAHRDWLTLWGPARGYTLPELAEWLPGIERHRPKRRPERVGIGRNVATFDWLRFYAYGQVKRWRGERTRGVYVAWLTHLYHKALEYTAGEHPQPLDHREVHHIAKSVARWVWHRYSAEVVSDYQARRGRKSGRVRRQRRAERDAAIVRDVLAGKSMRAVAREHGISDLAVRHILRRDLPLWQATRRSSGGWGAI